VTKSASRRAPVRWGRPSTVLDEGHLEGDFEGFDEVGTVFVFVRSRRQWRQVEQKCRPHYAYMPAALVIRRAGRCYLVVRGMSEPLLVEEVIRRA